ncbi:MAG: cell wall-active antibiotics response protein [Mediterranea sp.]|jgi:predicted membrane protein|nr:cell wall-active antibiotics response protein [Mediterranea sp.]
MTAYFKHRNWYRKLDILVTSLVLIVVGLLFLARNLNLINNTLFHALVSWQMLLIVIGVVQLIKQHYVWGLILIAAGGYFILPFQFSFSIYWPVVLIIIGIALLFRLWRPDKKRCDGQWGDSEYYKESSSSEDGFVRMDVRFGESKQMVFDPVFRGADLDVSFGSIVLDLRRTTLEAGQTYIDVNATFSGVEIYVPLHWYVVIEVNTSLSGVDDKRIEVSDTDRTHQLIIRGNLSFSGVDIKG